jgi:hypothetical protein
MQKNIKTLFHSSNALLLFVCSIVLTSFSSVNCIEESSRKLADSCQPSHKEYFKTLKQDIHEETCLKSHSSCGWKQKQSSSTSTKALPLLVVAIGVDGADHLLWQRIFKPVFDCVWVCICYFFIFYSSFVIFCLS